MAQELKGCDFCKFVNYEDSDDFYLYEVGTCKCEPLYSYEHTVKNRIIIHFVVNGKGSLVLNNKRYEVGPHQIFLIPENTKTFYQADKDEPWEYIWMHIGGPKIPMILKEAGLSAEHPVYIPRACHREIEDLAKDIVENYTRQYYCIGSIYKICDYMVEYSSAKASPDIENSLIYVKNVISYIQLKYSEPIKIADIAFALGLNRSYLTRLFKEATGYSLQDYLLTYRMKVASRLIKEGNSNISEIAVTVGYSDTFTFSKAFKRHFGYSPSAYKNTEYNESQGTRLPKSK